MKAKANKRQPLGKYLKEQLKKRPAVTAIMAVYLAFCIASSIYFAVIGRGRDSGYSLVYAAVVPLFYLLEYVTRQRTPVVFVSLILFWLFGSFIGACYNVYTHIRCWDDIMHAFWGVVFAAAGFAVLKMVFGEPDSNKKFFGCLIFSLAFCLMIGVFWEIYEFAIDNISNGYDMQEDTIVNSIRSFLLYPGYDHLHTLVIDGIAYTELYDINGNLLYTIEGGYLDIGLMDTMWDIIWCTVSAAALCVVLTVDRFCGKHIYKQMIPENLPVTYVEVTENVPAEEKAEISEANATPANEEAAVAEKPQQENSETV